MNFRESLNESSFEYWEVFFESGRNGSTSTEVVRVKSGLKGSKLDDALEGAINASRVIILSKVKVTELDYDG